MTKKPLTLKALATARCFSRETLPAKELKALARLCGAAELNDLATDMEAFGADAFLVEGDLIVEGDFKTSELEANLVWLVVKGNLTVKGLYEDKCFDAPDFVYVGGDLVAEDAITSGSLVVRGDLKVAGTLLGAGNDGEATIDGRLEAHLFLPSDHPFVIKGAVTTKYLSVDQLELAMRKKVAVTEWTDLPLAGEFEVSEVADRLMSRQRILK